MDSQIAQAPAPAGYQEFLNSKIVVTEQGGFEVSACRLSDRMKPHVNDLTKWAVAGGRRAVFSKFGLQKTVTQIQVLNLIVEEKGGDALVVCPLNVKGQFVEDAKKFFNIDIAYVRTDAEYHGLRLERGDGHIYVSNYERVRDGQLDPGQFAAISLDEASILRSRGSKTYTNFLPMCSGIEFRYVFTATPAPNEYKEIIHYADFLGIMDSGQALTRWFKRNSKKAGELTLHPHKEREFWHWVATWATFLDKPSDLGHSDEGYVMPPLKIVTHILPVDHASGWELTEAQKEKAANGKAIMPDNADKWGNVRIFRTADVGVSTLAREKRSSIQARLERCLDIIRHGHTDTLPDGSRVFVPADPNAHWIIWHDMEDERMALEKSFSKEKREGRFVSVYGSDSGKDLEIREEKIAGFSAGKYQFLAAKPSMCGSGCNFQKHCNKMVYLGIGWKFNDFIQSIHRVLRFMQTEEVEVHLIFSESEERIFNRLMEHWRDHDAMVATMSGIVRQYGLGLNTCPEIARQMGVERKAIMGRNFTCVLNDNVPETQGMASDSVHFIFTSVPFSDQYEYTPSYRDFGHNDGDRAFFEQMDFLTPELYRVLKPGRRFCVHVKERIVFGYRSGLGRYSVSRFPDKCCDHIEKHGFIYDGRITVDTDVVRENNQTNRLTRSEARKDGSKMGVGLPEYILIFYKPQSDASNGYADDPVRNPLLDNDTWQLDASGIWRSDGGQRFLTPEKIKSLPLDSLKALWKKHCKTSQYSYEEHAAVNKALLEAGRLPGSFQLLPPYCHNTEHIWEDIARMQTLNTKQTDAQKENHTCPLQFDVCRRMIGRYTQPGEMVLDPFGGLMTVPYIALEMGRKSYGIELNPEYFEDGVGYCRRMEYQQSVPTLWDLVEVEMELMEPLADAA